MTVEADDEERSKNEAYSKSATGQMAVGIACVVGSPISMATGRGEGPVLPRNQQLRTRNVLRSWFCPPVLQSGLVLFLRVRTLWR